MRIKSCFQLADLIDVLISCGESLEREGSNHWLAVAEAAATIEKMRCGKMVDLDAVSASLRKAQDEIAAVNAKIALKIAIAVSTIDALRMGFLVLEAAQRQAIFYIGIDPALSADKTVEWRAHHA